MALTLLCNKRVGGFYKHPGPSATAQGSYDFKPMIFLPNFALAQLLLLGGRPLQGTSECANEQKTVRKSKGFC